MEPCASNRAGGEFLVEPQPAALSTAPAPEPAAPSAVAPSRRSYGRPLWIFALCLIAAAVTLAARQYLVEKRIPPPPERFALEVFDRSGQIQCQWDRAARPVRPATAAGIGITNGADRAT